MSSPASAALDLQLIAILRGGTPALCPGEICADARDVLDGIEQLYSAVGYVPPWIGYLALSDGQFVGTCAFKSPPREGRVEIAYYCFSEFENRGIATVMAQRLVALARQTQPELIVCAQTLQQENASVRILRRLGFSLIEARIDPDDGPLWHWELR